MVWTTRWQSLALTVTHVGANPSKDHRFLPNRYQTKAILCGSTMPTTNSRFANWRRRAAPAGFVAADGAAVRALYQLEVGRDLSPPHLVKTPDIRREAARRIPGTRGEGEAFARWYVRVGDSRVERAVRVIGGVIGDSIPIWAWHLRQPAGKSCGRRNWHAVPGRRLLPSPRHFAGRGQRPAPIGAAINRSIIGRLLARMPAKRSHSRAQ
jgi:hypothetical protein